MYVHFNPWETLICTCTTILSEFYAQAIQYVYIVCYFVLTQTTTLPVLEVYDGR